MFSSVFEFGVTFAVFIADALLMLIEGTDEGEGLLDGLGFGCAKKKTPKLKKTQTTNNSPALPAISGILLSDAARKQALISLEGRIQDSHAEMTLSIAADQSPTTVGYALSARKILFTTGQSWRSLIAQFLTRLFEFAD